MGEMQGGMTPLPHGLWVHHVLGLPFNDAVSPSGVVEPVPLPLLRLLRGKAYVAAETASCLKYGSLLG